MTKRFTLRTAAMSVGVALLVAAAFGLATASSGATTATSQIVACQNSTNGDLRVIDPAQSSCRTNEKQISWAIAGPSGTQGPAGPAGPTGATGAAGPAGTIDFGTLIPVVNTSLPFPHAHDNSAMTVNCADGAASNPALANATAVYASWAFTLGHYQSAEDLNLHGSPLMMASYEPAFTSGVSTGPTGWSFVVTNNTAYGDGVALYSLPVPSATLTVWCQPN